MRNSFVHVRGIGYVTERRLWDMGITRWEEFLAREEAPLGPARTRRLEEGLQASLDALQEEDHRFFRRGLPAREAWRAFGEFRDAAAYLDIETTGMASEEDEITLIGLYGGGRMHSYVAGETESFPDDLARYRVLVTFNGASFDLPFLHRAFPSLPQDHIHIDLRHVLARLGMKGGLKAIERRMGIERTPRTRHLGGWDAVDLWQRHLRGEDEALDILIEYNREDVVNLETLAEMAYDSLRDLCLSHGFRTYSLRDLAAPAAALEPRA